MKYNIIFLLIFIILNGCINIKSDYPDIKYYQLSQPEQAKLDIYKTDGLLLIRDINIESGAYGSQIIANWDKKRVQKYFYHRWIDDIDLLIRDFFVLRINNSGLFKNGVEKTIRSVIPDYMLDISILDFYIESQSDNNNISFVNIELSIKLVRVGTGLSENEFILNKTYKNRIIRPDNNVENIASAVSKSLAMICDNLIVDISNSIINKK